MSSSLFIVPGRHYRTAQHKVAYVDHITDGIAYGSLASDGLCRWDAKNGASLENPSYRIISFSDITPYKPHKLTASRIINIYPGVTASGISPWMWLDRQGYTGPLRLVIHATSGPGEAVDTYNYFMGPNAGACAHFVVGRKGEVYQCGDPLWAASANCCPTGPNTSWWQAGNANFSTVSIEMQKAPGNTEILSDVQFQAVCKLAKWICDLCKIDPVYVTGPNMSGIITHSDLDPVHRPNGMCPGPFNMAGLLTYLKGGVMAILPNYPIVDQRNSPTLDSRPDENKEWNCVLASLISGVLYFRPELRGKIAPDALKDAVLGEAYQGGTAARDFIPYMESHWGITAVSYKSTSNADLIAHTHAAIQKGIPVLYTEIDPYAAGFWHSCVFHAETAGGLVAMDPYIAKDLPRTDAYWASQLVANEIWLMQPVGGIEMIFPTGVPAGWHDVNGVLSGPDPAKGGAEHGFRAHILATGWDPSDYPLNREIQRNPLEDGNPTIGPGALLHTVRTTLGYTTTMGVYHMYQGQELAARDKKEMTMAAQLAANGAQVLSLIAQVTTLQAQLAAAGTSAHLPQVILDDLAKLQVDIAALHP